MHKYWQKSFVEWLMIYRGIACGISIGFIKSGYWLEIILFPICKENYILLLLVCICK